MKEKPSDHVSRRQFIKTSAIITGATVASQLIMPRAYGAGSDTLRVGVIGCGGRGTGATINCMDADPGIEIVAIGDLFQDSIDRCLSKLQQHVTPKMSEGDEKLTGGSTTTKKVGNGLMSDRAYQVKITEDKCFSGFDAYKKVCDLPEVDVIITAAPPGFRPMHLDYAIRAGKHVFMEKPVAVDPVGVRSVIASAKLAKEKKLAIVAGTQRRHEAKYLETIARIHDGQIGEVVSGQCYWNMGNLWTGRVEENWANKEKWSQMEWQIRNWLFIDWLSGDHINEQHIHNLDVINWAIGSVPKNIYGMGGRQVRTDPMWGNIYDHFAIEYEYENGVRVQSMCRQTDGCTRRVAETVVGTKGIAYCNEGKIEGDKPWKFSGDMTNPYVVEHKDLIDSIRSGNLLNEGVRVAESNLTAICGRMSAYTGKKFKYSWAMKSSKLDLSPATYAFGDNPLNPVPMPGQSNLS